MVYWINIFFIKIKKNKYKFNNSDFYFLIIFLKLSFII